MKRQTGADRHREKPAEKVSGGGEAAVVSSLGELSDEEKKVLDCLLQAGTGLTPRQIVARVSCPEPAVESALDALLAQNLVARLNTLVPSYACRYPGVRVYTE